jgi:hypothetical protein
VIFDERGSNLNLTPLYARAPHNQRAYGSIPRNTPATTTLMASLSVSGIGPALIVEGACDRLAMEAYVEQVLAPSSNEGQVVLMDNLSAHKGSRVVVDVAFREEMSHIRMDHGPENFALIRHIALNLLRQETSFKASIKTKRLKAGWNNAYLAKVLCVDPR